MFLRKNILIILSLFIISFIFIHSKNAHANTLVKAQLIYPIHEQTNVPITVELKWELENFSGVGECQVNATNYDYQGDPGVSTKIPCHPGINTHTVNLRPNMPYYFSVLVFVDGYNDNISYSHHKFRTAPDVNIPSGNFIIQSPKNGETLSTLPTFSWTVPSNTVSTINMSICTATSPTAPFPLKKAVQCNTGGICNFNGDYLDSYFSDNQTIYWHVVVGDICWHDVKVSGQFTIKKQTNINPPVTNPPASVNNPTVYPSQIDTKLSNRLKGQIVLQVESNGEAFYINPNDGRRYYMANGSSAYNVMRKSGVGITNKDLEKIKTDASFRKKFIGKIFLQVESHGEAYYISSNGRYNYLKDGSTAYEIMRGLGLGISNSDLNRIAIGE